MTAKKLLYLTGFIIPGENGARPRLQLIPGKKSFVDPFHTLNAYVTYFILALYPSPYFTFTDNLRRNRNKYVLSLSF